MRAIGAYEAKTNLSRILERVANGEKITIEKHGVPIATLQPADATKAKPVAEAIAELKRFRAGRRLSGMTIREMIEKGRR